MANPTETRKAFPAVVLILALLFSAVAGAQFVNVTRAQPEIEYKTPPIVSVHSPANNDIFSVNVVPLSFTVTKPDDWLIHGGYAAQQILKSVNYQLDGEYSDQIPVNSALESPFDYSVNLMNLTDGVHSLKVYAYASGWVIQIPFREWEVPINSSSDIVYFTVDATPPAIVIMPVENKTYDVSDIPLNFTLSEQTSQITYSLDGQGNVTIAGNTTLTGLSYEEHNVTVYATDTAGHTGTSETIYFSISAPEPFPTTLVIGSMVLVAVTILGSLIFFRKRHRDKNP